MSNLNLNRTPHSHITSISNSTNLIYDLHSELANLKNQFSKLIKDPLEVPQRTIFTSRPNYVNTVPEKDPAFVNRQTFKRSDGYQRSDLQRNQQADRSSHIQKQRWTNIQKPSKRFTQFLQNSNYQQHKEQRSRPKNVPNNVGERQQIGRSQGYVFRESIRRSPSNSRNRGEKKEGMEVSFRQRSGFVGGFGSGVDKVNEVGRSSLNFESMRNKQDEHVLWEQKIKRLQDQKSIVCYKLLACEQQIAFLSEKVNFQASQLQEKENKSADKDLQIHKLTLQISQLGQQYKNKGIKQSHNEQVLKAKLKEIEKMKETFANDKRLIYVDFEKKLQDQKRSLQGKYKQSLARSEQSMKQLKYGYEERIKQIEKDKGQMGVIVEGKSKMEKKLEEQISGLRQKIALVEKLNKQQESLLKAQQAEIKQMSESKVNQQNKVKQIQAQPQTHSQTQILTSKSQQDKISLYLSNIDKQSQKITQLKTDLDQRQKNIEDNLLILAQKDQIIKNLMRDCKSLDKELGEMRVMKRDLISALEGANDQIIRLTMWKISKKYGEVGF